MTKVKNVQFLSLILVIVFFSSCRENKNRSTLPRAIGNTSEVLVVVQNDKQWDGTVGKTLRKYLEADQYGLPQKESLFKLAHINTNSLSELFQKHHSIIFIDVNTKHHTTKLSKFKNKWAKPQVIYKLSAPSNIALDTTFASFSNQIIEGLGKVERKRIMNVFNATADVKVIQKFADKFSLNTIFPDGFYVAKNQKGFMWLKRDANKYNIGILAVSVPYKATLQFTNASITARLMLFMKNFVPGPTDGSFMSIDTTYVPPVSKPIDNFFVPYTIETRGMWRVENDFMAGPFVAYTFINPQTKELTTLFGYVYKPNKNKRNLLRQIEAILYSTKAYDAKQK